MVAQIYTKSNFIQRLPQFHVKKAFKNAIISINNRPKYHCDSNTKYNFRKSQIQSNNKPS